MWYFIRKYENKRNNKQLKKSSTNNFHIATHFATFHFIVLIIINEYVRHSIVNENE